MMAGIARHFCLFGCRVKPLQPLASYRRFLSGRTVEAWIPVTSTGMTIAILLTQTFGGWRLAVGW
jgi:hypothetical protein